MNKKLVVGTILIIFALIVCLVSYKVLKNHHEKLLLVSEKYILEKAKMCFDEQKCTNETVTLEELYNLEYLEIQVNPVTKEYYNKESYIKKEEDNYQFIIID